MDSPFIDKEKIYVNEFSYSFYDTYPVSKGHMLVVPKRIVPEIFDLPEDEYLSCLDLVRTVRNHLISEFNPDGFNVGTNCGEAAGQTIFHAHIHIIPRYKGDIDNPKGGLRNIFPGKGEY
tara:strand:+ start:225 stop:584 length:360 start_codon:yes stop_codon:yes gene_type:complete